MHYYQVLFTDPHERGVQGVHEYQSLKLKWAITHQKLPKNRHMRPPFSSFYLEKCLNDSFRYILSQGTEENSNAICSLVLHFYVNTFVGDRLQSPNDCCRCLNYYNMIVCEPDLRCVNQALVDSLSQFLIVPDA